MSKSAGIRKGENWLLNCCWCLCLCAFLRLEPAVFYCEGLPVNVSACVVTIVRKK